MCSCSLFCHCSSCSPWWPLALPNSHRRHKVFIIFFQRNWTPLFFTLALALSFSVIHVYVDIKFSGKTDWALLFFFFLSKRPGGHAIFCRNARVLEM